MFSRKWCFNPYLFAKIEVVENEADKNIFLSNHNLQFEVESHFNSFSNFCMKIWVSGSSISDLFSTKNPQFIYTQCCSSTFRDLIVDTRICQPNQGPLKNWKEHSQELHLLKIQGDQYVLVRFQEVIVRSWIDSKKMSLLKNIAEIYSF